ncbi:CD276 antigen-like [Rhincodon typus]|uniref:CD276 antigen-like n=1 Tax=Rhincodon typus TaxID=259920 RepID=UPI00202E717A|nr:CD276 antigen-like [Rhincodon typus]XP_048469207.1 CD276 antigen-like [Rhincodon typus]XP_048469208.1 CD276 antigen-like [Rhincodon typus]
MQKISQFSFLVLWGRLALSKGFEVLMPKEQVIVILNQDVVLECNFTVTEESPLKNIVINWQLANTSKVVHSYYYGRDQLNKQNPNYSGITSLFPEEFKSGNASLRLEGVKLKHSGKYQCYVSTASGSGEEIITVVLAAFYSEPRLIIKQKPSSTSLTFESSGYPKADISWYIGDNKDASFLSNTSYRQDADGLYTVQSTMEINSMENNSTYTFVLRNVVVNQTISRTFTLIAKECGTSMSKLHWITPSISIVGSVLMIIALAILLCNKYIKAKSIETIVPNLP